MSLPPVATIASVNSAFASGVVNPVSLLEMCLQRARELSHAHVFSRLTEMRALQAAHEAAARINMGARLGVLDGVPMSWQDLFDQTDEVTRAGSLTTAQDAPKTQDAVAVSLLEEAGAVSIGRTNLAEFGLSSLGLNPHFGTPQNVWPQLEPLAPGGACCGAAISVAAGIVPYAMAADTSGAVRISAAVNGLAGFKPTASRISRIGLWSLSPTLDSIGALAHTVNDLCAVMKAFAIDVEKESSRHLKVVVPEGMFSEEVGVQIQQIFEQSLLTLEKAGIEIIRKPLSSLDILETLFKEYGSFTHFEAWQLHQNSLSQADMMDKRISQRLQAGESLPLKNFPRLLSWRVSLQKKLFEELEGALLLMPTTAIDAPPIRLLESDTAFFNTANKRIQRNTLIGSFLDLPGLTIPAGLNRNGLPAALLLSAPAGYDETVLFAGRIFARLLTEDKPLNRIRF
ncbi:MAG: amidase family protein [Neisseria sp.]|uniref:amidase family protein n=1 Tax=Neisseria sp. TaxID=192066 RepID=UPI0026DB44AE|nr:amidase family protein [Neisseria sp.]MDO4640602.1 amidase family protein [Neisseria sp.]